MDDRYAGASDDLLSPASNAVDVIPSDTEALAYSSKRLWVGGAGDVKLMTVGGVAITYSVPGGRYLQVRAQQIFETGTTATGIVAEF